MENILHIQVNKWGNSLAVRIPAKIAETLLLTEGSTAELSIEKGKMIISPRKRLYTLDEMLASIPEGELFEEISTGPETGREELPW